MFNKDGCFLTIHLGIDQSYGHTAKQRRQQVEGLSPAIRTIIRQLFYIQEIKWEHRQITEAIDGIRQGNHSYQAIEVDVMGQIEHHCRYHEKQQSRLCHIPTIIEAQGYQYRENATYDHGQGGHQSYQHGCKNNANSSIMQIKRRKGYKKANKCRMTPAKYGKSNKIERIGP